VGASQIEMAKRAISGHLLAAVMVTLGSVTSDLTYGLIAVFGIAPFMEKPGVLAAFNVLGVLILWALGFRTLKQSRKPADLLLVRSKLRSGHWSFVTGLLLSASNPPMILSWLLGVAMAKHIGLASPFPWSDKLLYVAGGALGLGSYLVIVGALVYRIKRTISPEALGRVYFWLGISLFGLSGYFIYGVTRYFVTR